MRNFSWEEVSQECKESRVADELAPIPDYLSALDILYGLGEYHDYFNDQLPIFIGAKQLSEVSKAKHSCQVIRGLVQDFDMKTIHNVYSWNALFY